MVFSFFLSSIITWQPFKFPRSDTQKHKQTVCVCVKERVPEGGCMYERKGTRVGGGQRESKH